MKKHLITFATLLISTVLLAQEYSFVPKGLRLLPVNELMTQQPPTDAIPTYFEDGTKTLFSKVMGKIMSREVIPKMYVNNKGEFKILVIVRNSKKSSKSKTSNNSSKNTLDSDLGIEAVPENLGREYIKNFNRYTKVVAPNGGSIHIVIQDDVTNEQAVRCRSILEHFLEDYSGHFVSNQTFITTIF